MEDNYNSWIRRTNYSHTIYHRLDPSKLAPLPLITERNHIAGLKSRPRASYQSVPTTSKIQRNPVTNKTRSVSPVPEAVQSDVFKEAKSQQKRFSTPRPQRIHSAKVKGNPFLYSPTSMSPSNTSPVPYFSKKASKSKKESAWSKYFDHGVGRVTAVETTEEWTVDLSKLFLGHKFAHGAHSQLYHGMYNEEPVAVKIIKIPDDDENGDLAARLEKQFNREVTLLSRLQHQNVIKVI